jgi:hypothetical protein
MTRRIRTAKSLGTRHDRNYFTRWTSSRRWRVGLTVALPLIGCVWLFAHNFRGNSQPYSSGPLAAEHNVFGNNCEACHVNKKNLFGRVSFQKHVTDSACLGCHNAPAHQVNEKFTPECSSCHVEHEGGHLLKVSDRECAQCHANLQTKSGDVHYETVVKDFLKEHPEFKPLRKPRDPGTIALNHEVHMKEHIRGPKGQVQMQCNDCHRPATDALTQAWPYGESTVAGAPPSAPELTQAEKMKLIATSLDELPPSTGRAHMGPIRYSEQCAACHQLQFDERIVDLVPHGKPEVIHDFVQQKYKQYLAAHPNVWRESPKPLRKIPGAAPPPQAHSPEEWVTLQTQAAETLLWRKNCKLCHTLDSAPNQATPKVRPANIAARWLPHSTFNHYAHQAVACDSCHGKVKTSKETSDVLIPGIETCRACHNAEPTKVGAAENGCFLCHQYHEWKAQQPGLKGKFTIEQLLSKKASPSIQ